MYQFQHEVQRKEKIDMVYGILFIVSGLVNIALQFAGGNILNGIVSLLFSVIVLHYGLRKKFWAEIFIKCTVWIHIVLLLMMFLVIIIK
ncbi:hypothetical protein [Peribacillus sp. NPDC097895]|uniref:hypothetical protein n=1 Tax=Peribacillus sp. NPDC097895 TaxID=3390619 RepID=UPI003D0303D3